MILGYNTNGFAHHRLADAVAIAADAGYGAVALTPDVHHLDPLADGWEERTHELYLQLRARKLRCCIETGARFVLDPRRKHRPTLLDADPARRNNRSAYLERCIAIAADLDDDPVVSFWSGTADGGGDAKKLLQLLADECRAVADAAADAGVRLAFEPEPGMFIDTVAKYAELEAKVRHPAFGLSLDLGHIVCQGEGPASRIIRDHADLLRTVHLDDMKPGIHDHLLPGEGNVDFADAFAALHEIHFDGIASVELSRHSHDAVRTAQYCMDFFRLHSATPDAAAR
jgi:L-ribulose-5-phosphate 3-epimerase